MVSAINRIAVLGAGTMGPGIAFEYAKCGYEAALYTRRESTLDVARNRLEQIYRVHVKKGLLTEEQIADIRNRLTYTTDLEEACTDVQLIVETIVENADAKRALYSKIDEICPVECIFASNTSGLDVFDLMPERRRAHAVIMHQFAPPELVPLIEIVHASFTDPDTIEIAKQLVEEMGKVYIVLDHYIFAHIVNRLQRALSTEAISLLDNGHATPQMIDLAVKSSIMPRAAALGLFQVRDFGGIDVGVDLDDPKVSETLKSLVRAGNLGTKTGKGFYNYEGYTLDELNLMRDEALIDVYEACRPFMLRTLGSGE